MRLFLLIFFLTGWCTLAQISPGDLTKAHANLEGISKCTSCHEIGERVKNSNCLACHKEVEELINAKRGYHSSSDVKGKNCSECHSEHHGRDFRIVNFNKDRFDHSKTTFVLTGKHRQSDCSKCHKKEFILNPESIKKNSEWMGLTQLCSGCHADYHQGTLGSICKDCHSTESFRPSLYQHSKSKFPLTGAHIKVSCIECHPIEKKGGKEFQKFTGIRFQSCENCHKDIHNGKLGKNCLQCHNTNSFRSVNQAQFDHDKTGFVLIGKHRAVDCKSCHKNNYSENLKYEKCLDCHKDFHNGEFIKDGITEDCKTCHNENGFTPSLYTIDKHNITAFPLTGGHLAVTCAGCHFKQEKWKFRNAGSECIDCHKDLHKNEISKTYYEGGGCRNCHSTINWNTISFDHNKTEFPLAGRHSDVKCRNCHFIEGDKERQRFGSLNGFCTECHNDVHLNQFGFAQTEECSRCHTFNNWKPEKFDHNKTKFILEGAHSKLRCSECHKTITTGSKTYIKYKLEDFRCASCHS